MTSAGDTGKTKKVGAAKKASQKSTNEGSASSAKAESQKKPTPKKTQKPKIVQVAKQIEESEKIPFSEVGSENNVVVPPPAIKPVAPVVKIRNRTPLPMPEESMPVTPGDSDDNSNSTPN